MNRRSILALGATATVLPLQAQAAKPRPHRAVQVVARDGTRLFHRDWGDGAPMVFMAGWTLTSEAWAYQAADLSDQGCAASPMIAGVMAGRRILAGATTSTPWPTTWTRCSPPWT
uniref:Uncharacterized protein n=1 Tax=Phenylobacterium glaciei TaxID=2803784 RepID=A0A974S947_9CAUL|nr:hypothetical protein JKL49_13430 [Phenylobacterium glaciei]